MDHCQTEPLTETLWYWIAWPGFVDSDLNYSNWRVEVADGAFDEQNDGEIR